MNYFCLVYVLRTLHSNVRQYNRPRLHTFIVSNSKPFEIKTAQNLKGKWTVQSIPKMLSEARHVAETRTGHGSLHFCHWSSEAKIFQRLFISKPVRLIKHHALAIRDDAFAYMTAILHSE